MSLTTYFFSAVLVFIFSGIMAMAGLGAAFLFVPLFYYLGVPLAEATPAALLLNVVSLMFAVVNYWRKCSSINKYANRTLLANENQKTCVSHAPALRNQDQTLRNQFVEYQQHGY